MRKHRILELLNSIPEDMGHLTIDELKERLSKEAEQERANQEKEEKEVCEKYLGKYLKDVNTDGLFGLEVEYIRIDEIKPGSYTTEFKRLYNIQGEKVSFAHGHVSLRGVKSGYAGDSMSADLLDSCEVITKEQYQEAVNQHNRIKDIVKQMQQ